MSGITQHGYKERDTLGGSSSTHTRKSRACSSSFVEFRGRFRQRCSSSLGFRDRASLSAIQERSSPTYRLDPSHDAGPPSLKVIRYLPVARTELIEAAKFYARQAPGLGDTFLDDVGSRLTNISAQPLQGTSLPHNLRRVLLKRFPFFIVYEYEQEVITVIAIAHTSRRPGYWSSRSQP